MRQIELVKVHNSNTSISIRDTCFDKTDCDLVCLEIGLLNKSKELLVLNDLSSVTKEQFLSGYLLDINSYTLGKTIYSEELLSLDFGVLEINYYCFNNIGSFSIVDKRIALQTNFLNYVSLDDVLYINNKIYTIDKVKTYDNHIVLNESIIIDETYIVHAGSFDKKYIVNDYLLERKVNDLLIEQLEIESNNKICSNKRIQSKDYLVTLILELKAIKIYKESCDIIKIASIIESLKNKLYANEDNSCKC